MKMEEKPSREKILFQIGDLQLSLMNEKICYSVCFVAENNKWWLSNGRAMAITGRRYGKRGGGCKLKEAQHSHYLTGEKKNRRHHPLR